jgi:hypothetical protein
LRQILFYQLADIANESLQGSPLYEIMWRGWITRGKGIITNLRYFFNAGWFWGRLADELPMIAPEPKVRRAIGGRSWLDD